MTKPKRFARLIAWYYRNVIFKNITFPIHFGSYKPELFEVLNTKDGIQMVYLGNNQYVEIKRRKK